MSNQLFDDSFPTKTRPARQKKQDKYGRLVPYGPVLGVEVMLTCHECGREVLIHYPWNEVVTLIQGGQVQGVVPDGQGWRGQVYCPGSNCVNPQGRTVLTYRLYYDDLARHLRNFQAGRRQVPQPPNPQQGGGGPIGGGGVGGGGWF